MVLGTTEAGSTAFQVAKTPGSVPVWSAVSRGSSGIRGNTKLGAAHTNGPSPQSREPPMCGKYGVNDAICCGLLKVCPPSVDRTTRMPLTWLASDVPKARHET